MVTGFGGSGISYIARKNSSLYSTSPFWFKTTRRLRTKSTSNGNNFFADSVSVGLLLIYNFEGPVLERIEADDGDDSGLVEIFGNGGAGNDIKPFLSGKRILTGEEL